MIISINLSLISYVLLRKYVRVHVVHIVLVVLIFHLRYETNEFNLSLKTRQIGMMEMTMSSMTSIASLPDAIIYKICDYLPKNDVACCVKFTCKNALRLFRDRTIVHLSITVPHPEFRRIWSTKMIAPHEELILVCLVAMSGSIENLELALDRAKINPSSSVTIGNNILVHAMRANRANVCRYLIDEKGCAYNAMAVAEAVNLRIYDLADVMMNHCNKRVCAMEATEFVTTVEAARWIFGVISPISRREAEDIAQCCSLQAISELIHIYDVDIILISTILDKDKVRQREKTDIVLDKMGFMRVVSNK